MVVISGHSNCSYPTKHDVQIVLLICNTSKIITYNTCHEDLCKNKTQSPNRMKGNQTQEVMKTSRAYITSKDQTLERTYLLFTAPLALHALSDYGMYTNRVVLLNKVLAQIRVKVDFTNSNGKCSRRTPKCRFLFLCTVFKYWNLIAPKYIHTYRSKHTSKENKYRVKEFIFLRIAKIVLIKKT